MIIRRACRCDTIRVRLLWMLLDNLRQLFALRLGSFALSICLFLQARLCRALFLSSCSYRDGSLYMVGHQRLCPSEHLALRRLCEGVAACPVLEEEALCKTVVVAAVLLRDGLEACEIFLARALRSLCGGNHLARLCVLEVARVKMRRRCYFTFFCICAAFSRFGVLIRISRGFATRRGLIFGTLIRFIFFYSFHFRERDACLLQAFLCGVDGLLVACIEVSHHARRQGDVILLCELDEVTPLHDLRGGLARLHGLLRLGAEFLHAALYDGRDGRLHLLRIHLHHRTVVPALDGVAETHEVLRVLLPAGLHPYGDIACRAENGLLHLWREATRDLHLLRVGLTCLRRGLLRRVLHTERRVRAHVLLRFRLVDGRRFRLFDMRRLYVSRGALHL